MLNLLTRERLLVISGVLLILLCVGVGLYIRAAGQADQAYREGELREEQVLALQEQAERTQALGEAREARLAEVLEEKQENAKRFFADIARLKKALPTQTAQEAVETIIRILKPVDTPPPKVSLDEQHVAVPIETWKAYGVQMADLTLKAARVPPLEAEVLLLREQSGNLAELLVQERGITSELEETVSAYKRSAKKGRFRRILRKIAVPMVFIGGMIFGSKL